MQDELDCHTNTIPHCKYPCFDVVVGLEWLNNPESYAGGSIAPGRISLARPVKGEIPD